MSVKINKVVFPVAGLGTRFLPVTKAVAKEMLPVLDKPLIQYAVDEAVAAGADTLVFVTNRYKHAIADYFDKAYELEDRLEEKGKHAMLEILDGILPKHVRAIFVTQPEPRGLGHAVLCAKPVVGNEPFAVMLPDDLIINDGAYALEQMVARLPDADSGILAVEEVAPELTNKYGIVDLGRDVSEMDGARPIRHIVEKPEPLNAPSRLGVVGRYILPRGIFEVLERTQPGAGGEIQLTDALEAMLGKQQLLAYMFAGERYDCGNKLGLVKATLRLALRDPELQTTVKSWLQQELSRSV